jgi:hypothetical protein
LVARRIQSTLFHSGIPLKDVQIEKRELFRDDDDLIDDRGVASYGTDGRTMLKASLVIMRTRGREDESSVNRLKARTMMKPCNN